MLLTGEKVPPYRNSSQENTLWNDSDAKMLFWNNIPICCTETDMKKYCEAAKWEARKPEIIVSFLNVKWY